MQSQAGLMWAKPSTKKTKDPAHFYFYKVDFPDSVTTVITFPFTAATARQTAQS